MRVKKVSKHIHKRVKHHAKRLNHHVKLFHKKIKYHLTEAHHSKRVVNHAKHIVHKHKHHFLAYGHLVLLFLIAVYSHAGNFMFANDETVMVSEDVVITETLHVAVPIEMPIEVTEDVEEVIEREILEEEIVDPEALEGAIESGTVEEIVGGSGELVDIEIGTGEVSTGDVAGSGEITTGEINTGAIVGSGAILTGEVSTGDVAGSGAILTGEVSIGDVFSSGGNLISDLSLDDSDFVPEDQNIEPLSAIYPSSVVMLNESGYVIVDSLKSVITTGGEIGATYCSRITYENIFRILKAGIRKADSILIRGNADHIITELVANDLLIEVNSDDMLNIFTGELLAIESSVYDIYITFFVNGERVYHRVTVLYGDDGMRYVLDPLRGNKSLEPQKLDEYIKYYDDEINVRWFIGQGYSPFVIKDEISFSTGFMENIQKLSGKVFSGNILLSDTEQLAMLATLTGEVLNDTGFVNELTGFQIDDLTGDINILDNLTGDLVLEDTLTGDVVLVYSGDVIVEDLVSTGNIEEIVIEEVVAVVEEEPIQGPENNIGTVAIAETGDVSVVDIGSEEIESVYGDNYFDRAYDLDEESEKIITLQVLLKSLGFYDLDESGIYDNETMGAVYDYQLDREILVPKDKKLLGGYLGPKTRTELNKDLLDYELQDLTTGLVLDEQSGNIDNILSGEITVGDINQITGLVIEDLDISIGENIKLTGLNEIGTISGLDIGFVPVFNLAVLFDPTINTGLYESLIIDTGMQNLLSGFAYGSGDMIGLVFDTADEARVLEYLTKRGYQTGTLTLMPVDYEALIGDMSIDLSMFSGKLMLPIVLQSVNEMSGQIAEVELSEGTVIKNAEGDNFTGNLMPPIFVSPDSLNVDTDHNVLSAIDVGSEEGVFFEDESGENSVYATFRIPVPGSSIGDFVSVNYSQDGDSWTYLNTVEVVDLNGKPYVIFEADHFTIFYLGTLTGSFEINNDVVYATGSIVELNNDVVGATHMRFGNTIAERDAAGRVAYNSTFSWNLDVTGDGIKRVYAQFSGNGVIRSVSDSIILDTSEASMSNGLMTHLDGSYNGNTFYDLSSFAYDFTSSAAGGNGVLGGVENIMLFNGSRFLSRATTPTISSTPFTISAWVRPDRVTGLQGIVFRGRSNAANRHYGINLNGTNFQITARNTRNRTANGTIAAQAGQWYHVVGVFDGNRNRTIYVNGVQGGTNTNNVSLDNTSQHRTVGKYPGTATNYFSGAVDEVRIYNRALSASEISELYMIPPTFDTQSVFTATPTLYGTLPNKIVDVKLVISGNTYNTTGAGNGKWKTLPMITGLANGTYNVGLDYTNVYGKTGTITYNNGLVVDIINTGTNIIYSPSTWTNMDVIATLTGLDPTYMIVNNFGSEFYTFTGNGNFTYQFVDKQGTTGTLTANVTWIDKIIPTFSGISSGSSYNSGVTITFSDANLSGAIVSGLDNSYYNNNFPSGTYLTGGGRYIFTVYDLAGNNTGAIFTIIKTLEEKTYEALLSGGYLLSGETYIGSGDIDFANLSGNLVYPLLLQSTNNIGGDMGEIYIPDGVILKNTGGSVFTGILEAPVFQTASNYDPYIGKTVISAIDVGSTNHIYFKDGSDNDVDVTFLMPVPGKSEGDLIDIYSSENGVNFGKVSTTYVRLIDGQPYVIFVSNHFSVVVTASNNGTNVSADKASNSTSGSAYTAISNIVIAEGANSDFAANQTNVTLILTAPSNWKFRAGSGTVSYIAGRDITAASISVTDTNVIVTFSTDNNANKRDTITISGLQVQAISGQLLPSSGNILRTSANPGTASIVGITNDVTNFGSLSQTFGAAKHLYITLPGQEFIPIVGNTGTALSQYSNSGFVINRITATDQFVNIVTSYTGNKTLSYVGPAGINTYTTLVNFLTGQSTTTLNTTLREVATGVTITVSDGTISGPASSAFDVLQGPYIDVTYNPTSFFEDYLLNNGYVSGSMSVLLSTGEFATGVANYISFTNLPDGLTGNYVLSGTNNLIVSFVGNASNHTSGDSVSNVIFTLLSGAISGLSINDVVNPFVDISITFFDPNPTNGIAPSDDTMIDADTYEGGVGDCADGKCQRMNYGAMDYICASDFGSKNLFRFDLASSLPTGAVVTSAQLNLYRYNIGSSTPATGFTIKPIINNPGWIEGTRAAEEALTGEVNYVQRRWKEVDWYNGSPGMQQGLDYSSTNLITVGGFTGPNNTSYNQSFDFNSAGVSLVQSWMDYPNDNQGIVMGDVPDGWLCIRSKEFTTESQRPSLSVTYYLDSIKPVLVSFSPATSSTGVSVNSTLVMNFDENVWGVSGKNIYIRKLSDNSIIETIDAASTGNVFITNNIVVINPSDYFESNTGYYINIDSGAFRDRAYNTFDGITGTSLWWFTTIDNSVIPQVTGAYYTGIYATTGILGGVVEDNGSGNIEERGVCWSTINGFNDCQGANIVSELGSWTNTGSFEFNVTGFNAGALIYFKAFARNADGTSYSNQNSFWTRPNPPILTIPTKIDNDNFYANWSFVTGASSYKLYLSLDAGFTSLVTGYNPIAGLTGYFLNVTGLDRSTQYYYRMVATNTGGDSVFSTYTGVNTTFYPRPVAWLKFEETAGNVAYDSAEGSFRDGINLNATINQTGVDGRAYCYNGTNSDVNIVNFNYGSYYTIGFWFKTNSTGNNMHMFSHGPDDGASSINVILDGATQSLRTYINGNKTLFNLGSDVYNSIIDNERHYYTVTVDNGNAVPGKMNVVVFVDGVYELVDASLDAQIFAPLNNLVLGRVSNTTTGYLSGCIDDFRIFEKVLSTGEVAELFDQLDPDPMGSVSITGPVSFDFGMRDASDTIQSIVSSFSGVNDYFKVIDTLGDDTGYYTTLSMSDMTNSSGDVLSASNISIKSLSGVQLLSGSANSNVVSAITGDYQIFGTGVLTFIKRDAGANGGLTGTYGILPTIKIDIPALQNVGYYTGTITYTIY